ncbi:MAG: hypothetical protein ICV73_24395 [Acetobacteraceae bacterium]|nr:hypothetical protein [Acetobacteraceae bacterium]
MQTPDSRTVRQAPDYLARRDAARPEALRAGLAAKPFAVLAGGLMLAGCASGIDKAENACAAQRTSMAAYAACLRLNHATLASGPPAERDLATLYMAAADLLAHQVRAGKISDAGAMFALAQYRTNELTAKAQGRYDTAFEQAMRYMQSQGQGGQGSGSAGGRSGQSVSYGGGSGSR